MATFKKGDICNGISADIRGYKVKIIGIDGDKYELQILENNSGNTYFDQKTPPIAEWNEDLELITDYQPITPKVGEKYRVLKKWRDYHSVDINNNYEILRVAENGATETTNGFMLWNGPGDDMNYLTTEYLELVEEPRSYGRGISELAKIAQEWENQANFLMGESMGSLRHGQIVYIGEHGLKAKPIKQPNLITKTMNVFKKAMLPADTKTLIKAGYLDNDDLTLTHSGKEALDFILFEKHKAELVAAAEAEIAEREAKK